MVEEIKSLENLEDWWEKRTFQEKSNMMGGQDDESYSMIKDQEYDWEWNKMTINEKKELYKDWN